MIFADTAYFLALINSRDYLHRQALAFSRDSEMRLLTTTWIIIELGNAVSGLPLRPRFVELALSVVSNPAVTVLPADEDGFQRGFELYQQRPDRKWSLTDCISFLVMQEHGITEALTADHHFTQAGFQVLLQN